MQVDYKWKEKAEELELKLAASEDKNTELQEQVDRVRKIASIGCSSVGCAIIPKEVGTCQVCQCINRIKQALEQKP